MTVLCPRCQEGEYTPYHAEAPVSKEAPPFPALSRTDNETHICSECGTDEAMLDFAGQELPTPDQWPV